MGKRSWSDEQLIAAVHTSRSIRQILHKLHLAEAGGNYVQIKSAIHRLDLQTQHLTGKGWNRGLVFRPVAPIALEKVLILGSQYQTHKLKLRLFQDGLKLAQCEECAWSKKSADGRLPLELHHKNGNRLDNRLENLQILCPNCHSLKAWYRGRNKSGEWRNGRRSTLKKL